MNLPFAHPLLPDGPARLTHILETGFLLYGILEKPQDLTLQGIGYSGRWLPPSTNSPLLHYVTLGFVGYGAGYNESAHRRGPRLSLATTNPEDVAAVGRLRSAVETPKDTYHTDLDVRTYQRYESVDAMRQDAAPESSCLLIDQFRLQQEVVVAEFRHWNHPEDKWVFTLRGHGVYVGGQAWSLGRDKLLELVGSVGILNGRTDIVEQYQRELAVWEEYLRPPE